MDRFGLAAGVARADQEVVGVAEHPAQVELDEVDRLLVRGVAGDLAQQLLRLDRAAAPRSRPGALMPVPGGAAVEAVLGDVAGELGAHELARSARPRRRARAPARRTRRSAASRGTAAIGPASPSTRSTASSTRLRSVPGRAATARSRQLEQLLRLAPGGQRRRDVGAHDERQLVVRVAGPDGSQGIHRVGRPAALDLERAHLERLARGSAAGTSPGAARRPGPPRLACRGSGCAGHQQPRESELAAARGARARGVRGAAG